VNKEHSCWLENISRVLQTGRMQWAKIFIVPAIVALCVGCKKPAAQDAYLLPTEAQPKLQTIPIYVGAETLNAELALTPEQEETGLMYRTNITDETAMIFVLPAPERASFWMTNCPMSLSAAYIGPDSVIEEIHHFEKNDNVPVFATNDNIQYVLEVNDGWFTRHKINPGAAIRTDRGSLAETFHR
jgi:hypothetical protein